MSDHNRILTWLGHSCFQAESEGCTIMPAPYQDNYVPGLSKETEPHVAAPAL